MREKQRKKQNKKAQLHQLENYNLYVFNISTRLLYHNLRTLLHGICVFKLHCSHIYIVISHKLLKHFFLICRRFIRN